MSPPEESPIELYDEAPCGYVTTQLDGTFARANRTFLDWVRHTEDELVPARRFQDLLTVPGRIFYDTHFAPLLRMQGMVKEVAFDLVRADGSRLPALANAVLVKDAEGRPASIRTTLVDITDRRRYEQELLDARRRAQQLAAVVEVSGDAIIMAGPDGTVRTWNGGAERMFGWRAEEVVGRRVRDFLVPPDKLEEYERLMALLLAGREVRLETLRMTRAGQPLQVSIASTPHAAALGEVLAVSTIMRDVSERAQVEEARRRAERLQVVSTLAGGVAHEVNNQMTVVLGLGEFVLRSLGTGHPQVEDVRAMMAAATRSARTSLQLLAFSRQQLFDPQLLELRSLVTELAPALSELLGPGRTLLVGPGLTPGRVRSDPGQMEQVLINLVANARDAMDIGGRLVITVEDAKLGEEEIRAHPSEDVVPGDYVLLSVSDDGSGMEPSTLARIFEPFFTTKPVGQGTGLGLSMVYGIVKQHGGQIWVTSEPGSGTTVRIYLPAATGD